jgi:hypothetical protein
MEAKSGTLNPPPPVAETEGMRRNLVLVAVLACVALLPSVVSVWMGEDGRTLLTDREPEPHEGLFPVPPDALARAWRGRFESDSLETPPSSSSSQDRYGRELRAALDDVRRGELKTGLRTLRRMVAQEPSRPEAAWYLARIERARGRLVPAKEALESALTVAAEMPPPWREEAERFRAELAQELAHAAQREDPRVERGSTDSEHFRVIFDHHFAGREYGARVLEILEQLRARLSLTLGRVLERPLDVRVYTRAQYLEAYQHRFGFATVGFYDGAIHVVSARQPQGELVALLAHEFVHAVFEEVLGGHEPFFLNEGIAEREEELVRGRDRLAQGEWRQLLDAKRDGSWVPLRELIHGFSGLQGERALLAYLESRAAVELLVDRDPQMLARWLDAVDRGIPWESALARASGWTTDQLDHALQREAESRFPRDPFASVAPPHPG